MFKNLKRRWKSYLSAGYSSDSTQNDTNFYRCKVCGFVCDSKQVTVWKEERKDPVQFQSGTTYPNDSDGDYYPDTSQGCPQCGTFYSL
jgi:hypothetical protein